MSVVSQSDLTGRVPKLEVLERDARREEEPESQTVATLLASQAKQLEETQAALEDAKLEIRSLREKIKSTADSSSPSAAAAAIGSRSYRNLGNYLLQNLSTYKVHSEEVTLLRNELRFAAEAEGKSQKAMDDLAVALKEVLTEASQLKGSLLGAQSDLEKAMADAESKGSMLKTMEEKYHAALEESKRLKYEIEESSAAWSAKEASFVNCIGASEEEMWKVKSERDELLQSQAVIMEENARLRGVLKQSASEANAARDDLEHAMEENARLRDLLSAKEDSLQRLERECDRLRISEDAAARRAKELKAASLATASAIKINSSKLLSHEVVFMREQSARLPAESSSSTSNKQGRGVSSSERWDVDYPRFQGGHRRRLMGEAGKCEGSALDAAGSPKPRERSISNDVSSARAAYWGIDDSDTSAAAAAADGFGNTDAILFGCGGEHINYMQRKKRTFLRRLRDVMQRKSAQEKR